MHRVETYLYLSGRTQKRSLVSQQISLLKRSWFATDKRMVDAWKFFVLSLSKSISSWEEWIKMINFVGITLYVQNQGRGISTCSGSSLM